MPNVPYPYEVNGKLVTGNGSLIPISSKFVQLELLNKAKARLSKKRAA